MSEEKSPADKPETPKSVPPGGMDEKGAAKDEKAAPNALAKDVKPADAGAAKNAKSAVPASAQKGSTLASPPKKGSGGSFFAGLFGGLIGGAIIVGGAGAYAYNFQQKIKDVVLQPEMSRISQTVHEQTQKTNDRIATLEKVVVIAQDTLREQAQIVAKVSEQAAASRAAENSYASRPIAAPAAPAASAPMMDDSALRALDRRLNEASAEIAALRSDIVRIQKSIPPEGALMRLADRAEQTESAFRNVVQQRNGIQALLLVVGQLRISVDSGQDFGSELAIAKRFTPAEHAGLLDVLGQYAATGVKPRPILAENFSAAQDAAIAANRTAKEGDIWGKVLEQASRLVRIRNTSTEGDGTEAIVARAEAAVRMNDLDLAVREMSSLPAMPRTAADSWIRAAEARIAADRALNSLTNIAIAASIAEQTTN